MNILKKSVLGFTFIFASSSIISQNDNLLLTAFYKSYRLEKDKDYAGSIEAVKAVATNPTYETNLRLGWLNYKAGFNSNAVTYYEGAVAQMPNSVEAKIGYNYPAFALGSTDNVIAQYKKVLEIDPQNSYVNFNLGSIYYYKNDFKNALGYFEKVNTLYPFDYDGLIMLAWTNLKLTKNAEAKIVFEKVLLYSPSDKSALEGLSYIKDGTAIDEKLQQAFIKSYDFLNKPDYKSAIAVLKEAYNKTSYEINARLGWLNYTAGFYKEAADYYKIAIELKPKAIEPKFGITYPLAALGNTNELIEQYKSILTIDAQNSTANYRLGYIYYEKKDYQTAYTHFEKIVKLYPFGYDGLLMFAWTNYRLGKNTEAKVSFNKVLLQSPNDKSALEGLGLIK